MVSYTLLFPFQCHPFKQEKFENVYKQKVIITVTTITITISILISSS